MWKSLCGAKKNGPTQGQAIILAGKQYQIWYILRTTQPHRRKIINAQLMTEMCVYIEMNA
jgi:hypothetical protein